MKTKKEQEIIEQAQKFNGGIETIKDLFEHLDRITNCSECGKVYWDKRCLGCYNNLKSKISSHLERKTK